MEVLRGALPELAAELVRSKVDFIVVANSPSAAAAKQATSTIPIIIIGGSVDPVGEGLAASLARPGGNVTGVALFPGPEVAGKYLEILKEAVSRLSQVAVLRNPGNRGHSVFLTEMQRATRVLRLDCTQRRRELPMTSTAPFRPLRGQAPTELLSLLIRTPSSTANASARSR
jgi:putative ABC transport system substrate-binding protein